MTHGYRKVVDDSEQLQFRKDETLIVANKNPEGWRVIASGERNRETIGTFQTKSRARQEMTAWMRDHPDGLSVAGLGLGDDFSFGFGSDDDDPGRLL